MVLGCHSFRYYDPNKPHHGKDGFVNNYNREPKASFWKWQWERLTTSKPEEPPWVPEVVKTDLAQLKQNQHTTLTWIAHSSALLQIAGLNILTDPIFSERASPFSFLGPKRQGELPFTLKQMPDIDVIVISHSHYDHMDLDTLKELNQMAKGKTLFLVPLGVKNLLQNEGITNVQELDWWDVVRVGKLEIYFTPTQHWSARTPWDNNQTLWGSWFFKSPEHSVYFAGDTGYSKDFQDIYEKLGAVDLALIPIGAYAPRWFMKQQHVNTDEAVQMHKDLHAKVSVAIHWGTFRLSDEPMAEPPVLLKKSLLEAHVPEQQFRVLKRGETLNLEIGRAHV